MARMQERQRTDGGISVRMEWRVVADMTAPHEETFSADSDAQSRVRADRCKQMVDAPMVAVTRDVVAGLK